MRVHRQRVDAARGELVLLVLHQRDERTDDDRQTLEHQRRQLIDERLTAAGRHDDERVAAREHRLDRLPLVLSENHDGRSARRVSRERGPEMYWT